MANDYLLIKGYPGTGKTTTIASIISVLVNLGKKILFTSFTNSAVDNLLLKIVNDVSILYFNLKNFSVINIFILSTRLILFVLEASIEFIHSYKSTSPVC